MEPPGAHRQPPATVAELRSQIKPETIQTVMDGGFAYLRRSSLIILAIVAVDAIFVIATMALAPYPYGLILLLPAIAVLIGIADGVVGYQTSGKDKDIEKQETRTWMKCHAVLGILVLLFAIFAVLGAAGFIALIYTLHHGDTASLVLSIFLIIFSILLVVFAARVTYVAYAKKSGRRYDQWGRNDRGLDFFGVPLRREWDRSS